MCFEVVHNSSLVCVKRMCEILQSFSKVIYPGRHRGWLPGYFTGLCTAIVLSDTMKHHTFMGYNDYWHLFVCVTLVSKAVCNCCDYHT